MSWNRPCIRLLAVLSLAAGCNVIARSQSLTVTPGVQTLVLHPGDSNIPVSVTLGSSEYAGPVSITLTGLPSGISVAPLTLSPGSSGTLFISASLAADQEAFPGDDPSNPDSATKTINVLAFAGKLQATAPISLTLSLENKAFVPQTIDRPILKIDTSGVPIASKTTNVPGTVTITSPDGQTSYLPGSAGTDNTATFHIHGNSTAEQPKKSYNIKLGTSTDLLTAMGLVCPYIKGSSTPICDKSKSYILLANYDDKTLLRDWAASALANSIPIGAPFLNSPADSPTPSGTTVLLPWAPHSIFVEVFLNGQYEGDYQLIEQVKVDSHRVNIDEMAETDISGNELTGGYLMEIDQRQAEDFDFITPQGVYVGLEDPDYSPEVPEQTAYIQSYVDTAEAALFAANYTDPTLGWRAYFDETAAINYYIINDVMGNADAGDFFSSIYLYKDEGNPLLYMGPVWDFDVSSGNLAFYPNLSATVPWMQVRSPWYKRWFTDPGFRADLVTQWNALKSQGIFSAWFAAITQQSATLQQTQWNNNGRWPMQGIRVWPNAEAAGNASGELAYTIDWIKLRMAYLDAEFNGKKATATTLSVPAQPLRTGSVAAFSAQVSGGLSPTGEVTLTANNVVLGTADLASNLATFSLSNLPAGADSIQAIYNGDDTNSLSASSPMNVAVLAPLKETDTNLTVSASQVAYGDTVILTAAVVPVVDSATPTGSISFTANGTALGSSVVSNTGLATLTATVLPAASDTLAATYMGDSSYQSSTSNTAGVTVIAPPANFSLQASSTLLRIAQGKAASVFLTITPLYYFSQPVSFTCAGLPSGAMCSFSPATITPTGGPVVTTLTIKLPTETAHTGPANAGSLTGISLSVAAVFFLFRPTRRRRTKVLVTLPVLLVFGLAITGCGSATTYQTSSFTVTASGGGLSQSVSLQIVVAQ